MRPADLVRVLMVSERSQDLFAFRQLAERNEFQCHFAKSPQEVAKLPDLRKIDIVLSALRIPGESVNWLVALLSNSRASAFYSLRVEENYWWLPVLRLGKDCRGTPAFRPGELTYVFDQLVKQIKANLATPS